MTRTLLILAAVGIAVVAAWFLYRRFWGAEGAEGNTNYGGDGPAIPKAKSPTVNVSATPRVPTLTSIGLGSGIGKSIKIPRFS